MVCAVCVCVFVCDCVAVCVTVWLCDTMYLTWAGKTRRSHCDGVSSTPTYLCNSFSRHPVLQGFDAVAAMAALAAHDNNVELAINSLL